MRESCSILRRERRCVNLRATAAHPLLSHVVRRWRFVRAPPARRQEARLSRLQGGHCSRTHNPESAKGRLTMTLEIHWSQIALRLALTLLAGGLLGWERSRTGHFAGLRTTLLVTLAASVAMIQMNLLLATNGKPQNAYAVMDVMRLPLGILTGVGFIGAGAIVRKSELVLGITTAATLWFSTVVGLCLGGGQLILGSVSTLLGYIILWGLRWFERRIERFQMAQLRLSLARDSLSPEQLRHRIEAE